MSSFQLPNDRDLTANEIAWIAFFRIIAGNRDPAPTLSRVQALRRLCTRMKLNC
jgi:hypothetical protein